MAELDSTAAVVITTAVAHIKDAVQAVAAPTGAVVDAKIGQN